MSGFKYFRGSISRGEGNTVCTVRPRSTESGARNLLMNISGTKVEASAPLLTVLSALKISVEFRKFMPSWSGPNSNHNRKDWRDILVKVLPAVGPSQKQLGETKHTPRFINAQLC